ncbi:uncharacterized protein LOC144444469 [Glandiceps talaboti]
MASSDESDDDGVRKSLKDDLLTCQLCFEVYTSPKVLSCQHSFCEGCLQRWVDTNYGRLVCPCCRKQVALPVGGVKGLASNTTLRGLLEHLERPKENLKAGSVPCDTCTSRAAKKRCVECEQYMCGRCNNVHSKGKLTKLHNVMALEDFESEKRTNPMIEKSHAYCEKHPDTQVELYCKTCEIIMCLKCALSQHPNPKHRYISLEDAACEVKERFQKQIEKLNSKRKKVAGAQKDVQAELCELEKQYKLGEAAINKHANKLMQNAQRMQKEARESHQQAFSVKQKVLQKQLSALTTTEQSLINTKEFAELQVNLASPAQFLVLEDDMQRSISDVLSADVNTYPEENSHLDFVVTGSSTVEKFGKVTTTAAVGFQTSVSGIEDDVQVGDTLTVKVHSKDRNGKPGTLDTGTITAMLFSPSGDVSQIVTTASPSTIKLTTEEKGVYKLDIKVCGQPVRGSPFMMNCYGSHHQRKFDRESLLKLQFKPLSLKRPEGLPAAAKAILVDTLLEKAEMILDSRTTITAVKVKELLNLPLHTEEGLKEVVNMVYDKAVCVEDTKEISVYAEICIVMSSVEVPTSHDFGKTVKFSDVFEDKVTSEFREPREGREPTGDRDEELQSMGTESMNSNAKSEVRFVTELLTKLFSSLSVAAIKWAIKLLTAVGESLDQGNTKKQVDKYFHSLNEMLKTNALSMGLQYEIGMIIKLRSIWVTRRLAKRIGSDEQIRKRAQEVQQQQYYQQHPLYPWQEHLEQLILREKASNVQIIHWIETNVSMERRNESDFIRALMTAVCKGAVSGEGGDSRCNINEVKNRASLLQKYLHNDDELELQALYALQALNYKLGSPPSLLRIFFDKLYDEDLISEEALWAWKSSNDPNEQLGKEVALRSVDSFFTWLREADDDLSDY